MGAAIRIAILAQAAQARREFRSLGEAAGDAGKSVESKLGKLGGAAKAGAAAAGVAVGAALVGGVSQALEQGRLSAKLGAQLGLTKDEAAKVGKLAGKVYADGFGEDVAQVNNAIKGVYQNIGKGNEQWTSKITKQVLGVAEVFEKDLGETTAAVGQLLRTGLAKDAEAALDVLTRGLQTGADKAGDLFDTFTEYGTQFRKFGLNARQATGLLTQGLRAGARDADVVADALKEFSILALDGNKKTQAAFKAVGLSAKKVTDDIAAGGPRAAGALDAVLDGLRNVRDPAERAQLAVALFGTKAEDLGDALFALDLTDAEAKLGDVAGAAQRAGDAMGETASAKVETFKRKLSQGLVGALGATITKFDELVKSVPESYWRNLGGSLDGVAGAAGKVRDAFAGLAAAVTGQDDGYGAFLQGLRVLRAAVDTTVLVIGNLAFQLHTAAVAAYTAKAGWLFLTGDVDGARDAMDRARQSTGQATEALEGQRRGVENLKRNWEQGGRDIQKHQQGIADKAATVARATGDQHDRGANLASGSYTRAAASIRGAQSTIGQTGTAAAGTVSRSHTAAAAQTSVTWSKVPGAIRGYFANATLGGAGISVMGSFLSGARSTWDGQVVPWLKARAAQIKQLKGPPAKDRKLLVENGQLVMRGFREGLEREFGLVRSTLVKFTRTLPNSVPRKALQKFAEALPSKVAEQLKAIRGKQQQAVADIVRARGDYARAVAEAARGQLSDITMGDNPGAQTSLFVRGLQKRLNAVRQFHADVSALVKRGVGTSVVQQLIDGGVDRSGALAKALRAAPQDVINQVRNLNAALAKESAALGVSAGTLVYGPQEAAARRAVTQPVTIEVKSGGSKMDALLVEILRKAIRVQGGNVQAVLGR